MLRSLVFALWPLVAAVVSFIPDSIALRVRKALSPHAPTLLQFLAAVLWGLQLAHAYAYFEPLAELILDACRATDWLSTLVKNELVVMGVAPPRVEGYYTAADKFTKQPHVRCRATENGEACYAIATVRRFTIGGVDCASVTDLSQFPTYLCLRHIRLLPKLSPALSDKVRPSPSSRFVFPVPEVPGYTTAE